MYRKGVSALIINNKGEFLLANLRSFEEQYFAVPGGGVEEGETLEEAAYREIAEELGIEKELLELTGASNEPLKFEFKEIKLMRDGKEYRGSERNFFGLRFLGTDDDIKLLDGEVRAFAWVSYEKLGDYLLFDNQHADTLEKVHEIFPKYGIMRK